jgi:hypothetical protein
MKQVLFPNDAEFWYETQHSSGGIAHGGTEFGDAGKAVSFRPPTWHKQGLAGASRCLRVPSSCSSRALARLLKSVRPCSMLGSRWNVGRTLMRGGTWLI